MHIRDTPHSIAGGVAIGATVAATPLFGFKTLLALAIAWFSGCSKLSAVITVTLTDVFLPVWPVLLRWQYILGFWLIHQDLPPRFEIRNLHVDSWWEWQTVKLIWPILLGSLAMGIPLAVGCYFAALKIVTRSQTRRDAVKAGA